MHLHEETLFCTCPQYSRQSAHIHAPTNTVTYCYYSRHVCSTMTHPQRLLSFHSSICRRPGFPICPSFPPSVSSPLLFVHLSSSFERFLTRIYSSILLFFLSFVFLSFPFFSTSLLPSSFLPLPSFLSFFTSPSSSFLEALSRPAAGVPPSPLGRPLRPSH